MCPEAGDSFDAGKFRAQLRRDGHIDVRAAELESYYVLTDFASRFVEACRAPKLTIAATGKSA